MKLTKARNLVATLLFVVLMQVPALAQTGHILDAVGPINQSMGGAGTAMPLDAMGALYRNSASIMGLDSSEVSFGFQIFAPESQLESSVLAGSFGPGVPAASLIGSTSSDTDISPIPSFAFVCRPDDSRWSYGISGFGIGGFGVDYASSSSNPITSPQPPNGFGFGPIFSNFQLLQITATFAYQLTERTSFGVGLNGDWSTLSVSPFAAASPDDANGDGFASYPSGSHGDAAWGLGFQTGIYYNNPSTGIHLGASYKSPQWMQTYKINSQDELGSGRLIEFDLDYPMMLSLGAGYSGIQDCKFAADLFFIDYESTEGFQPTGFDGMGAATGFGWRSIWGASIGGEYQFLPRLALRTGYTFNQSPIRDQDSFFNVNAPGIIKHHLSGGFSYETHHDWIVSMAFHHGFGNSITGPWQSPAGPIPGTSVTSRLATYSLTAGLSKKY